MKVLKKIVKNVLNKWGYDIIPFNENLISEFDRVYEQVYSSEDDIVVLDVGAHRGESINRFKRFKSSVKVIGFEPDIENYRHLHNKYGRDTSVMLFNVGIGSAEGTLPFFRYAKSDVGGFNQINTDDAWTKIRSAQLETDPDNFLTNSYEVPVSTIDSVLASNSIERVNILKIDTQGFEEDVLRGCKKALSFGKIDFIELELIIRGPYNKTLSFSEIEEILNAYGYKLYGIQRGSNYYFSPILQFDILFARQDLYLHRTMV